MKWTVFLKNSKMGQEVGNFCKIQTIKNKKEKNSVS